MQYSNTLAAVVAPDDARWRLHRAARPLRPIEMRCPSCRVGPGTACKVTKKQHDGPEHVLRRLAAQRASNRLRDDARECFMVWALAVQTGSKVSTSPARLGMLMAAGLVDENRNPRECEVAAR